MIYLINNVYLSPDKLINVRPGDDSIIVSADLPGSSFHIASFFSTLQKSTFKEPKAIVKSFDDLLVAFGGKQRFVDFLLTQRENRLVIICDEDTMLTLALETLKTILPNATASTAAQLLKYMYLPYFYLYDSKIMNDSAQPGYRQIYLNMLTRQEEIALRWNTLKAWKLDTKKRQTIHQTASIEMQTATFFANPSWAHAREYKRKIVAFAKRNLLGMLFADLRQKLVAGFVDVDVIVSDVDPLDATALDQISNHPILKFLVDPMFTPTNWMSALEQYDIDAIYDLYAKYAPGVNPSQYSELRRLCKLAQSNTLSFDDILAHEIQSVCGRKLLGTDFTKKDIVNIYMLDFFFDLYKNNQQDKLREFSLESLPKR